MAKKPMPPVAKTGSKKPATKGDLAKMAKADKAQDAKMMAKAGKKPNPFAKR